MWTPLLWTIEMEGRCTANALVIVLMISVFQAPVVSRRICSAFPRAIAFSLQGRNATFSSVINSSPHCSLLRPSPLRTELDVAPMSCRTVFAGWHHTTEESSVSRKSDFLCSMCSTEGGFQRRSPRKVVPVMVDSLPLSHSDYPSRCVVDIVESHDIIERNRYLLRQHI